MKKQFWEKVDRVVLFKVNTEYFTEQEKLMSRNLEHLLSQTEKYTKALIDASASTDYGSWEPDPVLEERELNQAFARVMRKYADDPSSIQETIEDSFANDEKIKGKSTLQAGQLNHVAASPKQLSGEDDDGSQDEDFEQDGSGTDDDEDSLERDEALSGDDGGVDALMADNEISIEELRARYADAPPLSSEEVEVAVEDAASAAPAKSSSVSRTRIKRPVAPAHKKHVTIVTAADDAEGSSSDADFAVSEDESDDEDSLARDEALGGDDGGVDALIADNEIPIEELRARYADAPPLSDKDEILDDSVSEDPEEQRDEERMEAQEAVNHTTKGEETSTLEVQLNTEEAKASSSTDDDFVAEEESDDEASLARDEALGGDDGGVDALLADNEIPIEELRARYANAPPVPSDEDDLQDEDEDAPKQHSEARQRRVPIPFLLSSDRPLREYQRAGLDWLVSLHDRALNGILADEMGLGAFSNDPAAKSRVNPVRFSV